MPLAVKHFDTLSTKQITFLCRRKHPARKRIICAREEKVNSQPDHQRQGPSRHLLIHDISTSDSWNH
jgi:hypothetical protein